MEYIVNNWQEIIGVFTALVTAASIIVKLTPTESDNKILDAVLKATQILALNKKA